MNIESPGQRIRRIRTQRGLTQEQLAQLSGRSTRWLRYVEADESPLDVTVAQRLAAVLRVDVGSVLGITPIPGALTPFTPEERAEAPKVLAALELEANDLPSADDIEQAVLRLRRSYSTTPPDELQRRIDVRLRQIRRLMSGEHSPQAHRAMREAAAWLALLRGTVQADQRLYEAAETSIHVARELAREIGHTEIEAWTWETTAWIAATTNRRFDAREAATMGMSVAPVGGYGLVAATMQRARINGELGDKRAVLNDLLAGERAQSRAGIPDWPDDHYSVDPAKAAFFASGAFAQLHDPKATIEHAAEVVRSSSHADSRNFWPMRAANARVEWAMALVDLGDEDAAVAMATLALDPEWLRPDTERRTRILLRKMRDPRLQSQLTDQLHVSMDTATFGAPDIHVPAEDDLQR